MDPLLKPAAVAELFGVSPKTITRWAETGRLPFIKTPTGHRRFRTSDVKRIYESGVVGEETEDV